MNVPKAHLLIKKMTAAEKAYFKKYAFKGKNAKHQSYHILFDLLDKQEEYNPDQIKINKKIDATLRKNISSTLNTLYQKLIQSLVDFSKAKQKNKIFAYLEEEEVLRERGLFDQAEKVLIKCQEFADEKFYYFLKPYVNERYTTLLRNNTTTDLKKFDQQIERLNTSMQQLQVAYKINMQSYQLERMIHANGGIVVKSSDDFDKIERIINEGLELLPESTFDFWFQSVLVNNLLVFDLMAKEQRVLPFVISTFLENFEEKIVKSNTGTSFTNASLVLKNLIVFAIYQNLKEVSELIQRYENLLNLTKEEYARTFIHERLLQIKVLQFAMNPEMVINVEIIEEAKELFLAKINQPHAHIIEMLVSLLTVLIEQKAYDQTIELANQFINAKWNTRIRDEEISIRMLLAIAWLKKGNVELNESMMRSVYRSIFKNPNFPLQKEILLFIKNLKPQNREKQAVLRGVKNLSQEIDKKGSGTEKMKARELERIAILAFT